MPADTPQTNPYGAPRAPVGDYVANSAVLEQARSVPADHGVSWYREAWRLFKVSPGLWIGMWLVFVIIIAVINMVPLIGSLVVAVLTPILLGGTMIAARNADRTNAVTFGDLFAAFSGRAAPLAIIGLIQLAVSVAFFLVFGLIVGFGGAFAMFSGGMSPEALTGGMVGTIALVVLASLVVFVPLTNAVWLGSALVALEGAAALDAFRRGLTGTFRNILPLIVFVLLTFVLAIAASIPLGLGWLVLGPVIFCAMYAQFVDLFDAAGLKA